MTHVRVGILGALVLLAIVFDYVYWKTIRVPKPHEVVSLSEVVNHYRTKGIADCGYDTRNKGERAGAVLLEGNDRARAIAFLKEKYEGEISEVLFTHAPEATATRRGQPALIPLKKESDSYCALGLAGSYAAEPFVSFEAKYGNQLKLK